ncbi:MAG: hypothetical protein NTW05_01775 [Pseudonocardiales bacterium]|nr:hypothetical protein [Pseudonocardiales bacterium]
MSDVLVDLGAGPGPAVPSAVAVPMQGGVEPPPGQPEFGKASPVALVVILLLGLATALLIVSMTRHLKKVPASFDPPEDPPAEDAGEPRP